MTLDALWIYCSFRDSSRILHNSWWFYWITSMHPSILPPEIVKSRYSLSRCLDAVWVQNRTSSTLKFYSARTWYLPWNLHKLLWYMISCVKGLCQLSYTLHEPLPAFFTWCSLFLLLEEWILNSSLLLEYNTIFFIHLLICLFSN